jgi:hypothetical protein
VEQQSVVKVTKDDALYATVTISRKNSRDDNPKSYLTEEPWLFEKLTGIPRDCFPEFTVGKDAAGFEQSATVEVAGNKEAEMRFPTGK